jgi:hypothetical protein
LVHLCANIAIGEVLKYQDEVEIGGYHEGAVKVRVLKRLKGLPDWKIGEIRDVQIAMASKSILKVRAGSHLVLIAGFGPLREMRIDPATIAPFYGRMRPICVRFIEGLRRTTTQKIRSEQVVTQLARTIEGVYYGALFKAKMEILA